VKLADLGMLWGFQLPQLANAGHVACLARAVQESKVELLLLDPLYLALLAGSVAKGLQASNLMDVGPLLMDITRACLQAGATPVVLHHTKKTLTDPYQPLELTDLAYSGVAEFARQWILINRREKFEQGSGLHRLWMVTGGSIGTGNLYALDINEGVLRDDFTGRIWEVSVANGAEARQKEQTEKKERKDKEEDGAVLATLDRLDSEGKGVGKTRLREDLSWSAEKLGKVLARLYRARLLEQCQVTAVVGNGAERTILGVRRPGTDKTEGN
jgi:hypothetical protein